MLYMEQLGRMHRRYLEARGISAGLQAAKRAAPDNAKIRSLSHNAGRMVQFYYDLVSALRLGTTGLVKFITIENRLRKYADVVSVKWWTHEIDKWIGAEEFQAMRDVLGGS